MHSTLPPIVHIVLCQLARLRTTGNISDMDFEQKVQRLENEELTRRGYTLQRREPRVGKIVFIVRSRDEGIECDRVEAESNDLVESYR